MIYQKERRDDSRHTNRNGLMWIIFKLECLTQKKNKLHITHTEKEMGRQKRRQRDTHTHCTAVLKQCNMIRYCQLIPVAIRIYIHKEKVLKQKLNIVILRPK